MPRITRSGDGRKGAAARPLTAERDAALWDEVTRGITPLRPRPPKSDIALQPRRPAARPEPLAQRPASRSGPPADKPIEPGLRRKLVRGQEAIDASLDLHGFTQAEALPMLIRFIRGAVERGARNVLVITGKGLRSEGAKPYEAPGVLRQALPRWLKSPALAPLVAGVSPAARGHGGEGAFYVRLKRQ